MKKYSLFMHDVYRGFTLVELLVTIAIAGILIGVAIPSFVGLSSSKSADTATQRLQNSLAYARSEAVTRAANVSVCASSNGTTCSGTVNWNSGWLVFSDDNASGSHNDNDETVKVEDVSAMSVSIAGNRSFVCYNSSGEQCGASPVTISFAVLGVDGDAESGSQLNVLATGSTGVTSISHSDSDDDSDDDDSDEDDEGYQD